MSTLTPEEIEALAASFGIGPHSGKAFADALRAKWFAEPVAWCTPGGDLVWDNVDNFGDWGRLYVAPQEES